MQFNPGVNDISGQILGQGVAGAAKTRADMMSQMGQDIGGAIENIGGALTNSLEFNNMGDSAFEGIKAISEMYPGMKKIATSLENLPDRERRMASLFTAQNFGALSQFAVAGMRDSTQQAGQQLDRDRPFIDASLKNLGNTAAGNIPYGGSPSQDPANTVALPTGPSAPVDQAATPAAVAASVGASKMSPQDWEKMRADFAARGRRDPGPYPY